MSVNSIKLCLSRTINSKSKITLINGQKDENQTFFKLINSIEFTKIEWIAGFSQKKLKVV